MAACACEKTAAAVAVARGIGEFGGEEERPHSPGQAAQAGAPRLRLEQTQPAQDPRRDGVDRLAQGLRDFAVFHSLEEFHGQRRAIPLGQRADERLEPADDFALLGGFAGRGRGRFLVREPFAVHDDLSAAPSLPPLQRAAGFAYGQAADPGLDVVDGPGFRGILRERQQPREGGLERVERVVLVSENASANGIDQRLGVLVERTEGVLGRVGPEAIPIIL